MRKVVAILMLVSVCGAITACSAMRKCETEPIVEENHKLIVPPNFGKMPQ